MAAEAPDDLAQGPDGEARLRIDRWLWFARFFKSRSAASQVCNRRRIRSNGKIVSKASHMVKAGDTLTFPQSRVIRTVRIVALGSRRGPADEAQLLYEDMTPPTESTPESTAAAAKAGRQRRLLEPKPAQRLPGSGRPTKSQRRALDRLRRDD